ncbi:MAG: C40 family peptidase [Propionibacterium sp.]
MPAHRALLEESADSVIETTVPRRALVPSISQTAILTPEYCNPRRARAGIWDASVARAVTKPRSRRSRLVLPAAAVLLSSAFGLGVSLAPQASAEQSHPANTTVSVSSDSVALATTKSSTGTDVMNSSVGAITDATRTRLANESAVQAQQASQQDKSAAALAAVGKSAADKISADAKTAADKAAAEKAAADQAAAAQATAAAERTAAQQAAAAKVASAATSSASTSTAATTTTSSSTTKSSTASTSTAATTTSTTASSSAAQAAVSYALAQVGKAYAWGASGPDSFDCSGLTQAAYASAGVSLPRTTYAQVSAGTSVSTSALQPGDLLFFYGNEHVGIYIGDGKVVHAADYGIGVIVSNLSSMPPTAATRVA